MTSRTEFLDRIRAGLGPRATAPTAIPTPPPLDESLVRLTAPGSNLADTFTTRAAAASLVVHRTTPSAAAATIGNLLVTLHAKRIVLDPLDPTLIPIATPALANSRAEVINPQAARSLDPQFDADLGITGVVAAIAETGTLVLASDALHSRGTFIIPPVHIALVHEHQLIPDLIDLWPFIAQRFPHPPTALTLVSGPSKTADIEGILVTGVHGPGAVHIILIAPQSFEPQPSEPRRGVTP